MPWRAIHAAHQARSIFCNAISIFIIVATAAAIHVRAPLESAKQAAQALAPVAGRFATQLFAVGLLGASALAAAVVPLSTANAISEATGAERSVSKSFRQAALFLGLFTGQVFIGAAAGDEVLLDARSRSAWARPARTGSPNAQGALLHQPFPFARTFHS